MSRHIATTQAAQFTDPYARTRARKKKAKTSRKDKSFDVGAVLAMLRGTSQHGSAGRLTQERLGGALGISPATIRNWEQGRSQPTGPALVLLKLLSSESSQGIMRQLQQLQRSPP